MVHAVSLHITIIPNPLLIGHIIIIDREEVLVQALLRHSTPSNWSQPSIDLVLCTRQPFVTCHRVKTCGPSIGSCSRTKPCTALNTTLTKEQVRRQWSYWLQAISAVPK